MTKGIRENVGKIVHVMALDRVDEKMGPVWWVTSTGPMMVAVIHPSTGKPFGGNFLVGAGVAGQCRDAWLLPITPPPGTDLGEEDAAQPIDREGRWLHPSDAGTIKVQAVK